MVSKIKICKSFIKLVPGLELSAEGRRPERKPVVDVIKLFISNVSDKL